jgi:2-oxoglutarate/2-oxoacid ferredoxin oxidoreductase subunit beta
MMDNAYLAPSGAAPYCKGCGHNNVLRALGIALENLKIPPADLAMVTDIGCVGLADSQFAAPHTVHTTHGRSTAFAAGLGLADSVLGSNRLKPIVMIGDGGSMIGINHLIHAALLNVDVTVLVHNNFLFGMTGGQNSTLTPLDFVTATTKGGNQVAPLDLARLLIASRASFVARKIATDADLPDVLAQAIQHRGFAMVEILELCTAYGTRWNNITGANLRAIAADAGYELGVLHSAARPIFGQAYRQAAVSHAKKEAQPPDVSLVSNLSEPVRLVLAGTAGEHVQSAASALAQAAILCGLHATQKNDNPVTQGTGFSVSELILSPDPILFTGIEVPDAVLVVSQDGAQELVRNGVFHGLTEETFVLADEGVTLPECAAIVQRFSFRAPAGGKNAAAIAIAQWLEMTAVLPIDAFLAALDRRQKSSADALRAALASSPTSI